MVASHHDWKRPQIIVIDFGLANKFSSKSGVGGTPGYMPPEVWDWGLWTPRGDVFSIGVMMFSIRNGRAPFNPTGRASIEEIKQTTKTLEPFNETTRGSPQLQTLVKTMLNKQFLRRPTVSQMMQDPWFQSNGTNQALDMQALHELTKKSERSELYRSLLADMAARKNMSQLKELNETFMRLDVNNDGQITAEEVRIGLKGMWNEEQIERLIAVLGINSGGKVSYDEFLGELLAAKEPEENAMLQRIFNEADLSGRGYLDGAELAALARRPAIVQILGPQAEDKLKAMDPSGRGVVTFGLFRRAVQGTSAPHPPQYRVQQDVQYWSQSNGIWVSSKVTRVDEAHDAVQIECKPGAWLTREQMEKLLRPLGHSDTRSYREGQRVDLWSRTYNTWIPCKVTHVDTSSDTGGVAVQVDQKPGYWWRGDELKTRLRSAPPGGGAPQPLNVATGSHPAARAGAGRQLFDAALRGGYNGRS